MKSLVAFSLLALLSCPQNLPALCLAPCYIKSALDTEITPVGKFDLARRYLKGDGVEKDEKQAFKLMTSAANAEYPDALSGLGFLYLSGIYVKKNEHMATYYLKKGADKGSAKAQLNLGIFLISKNEESNTKKGLRWVEMAAEQWLPEALFAVGEMSYTGINGMPKDLEKAFSNFSKAADKGHPEALNRSGEMLEKGIGVAADLLKAENSYRLAAKADNTQAQSNLGRLLSQDQDQYKKREGLFWLCVASQKQEKNAQKTLDELTLKMDEKDIAQACIASAEFFRSHQAPENFKCASANTP